MPKTITMTFVRDDYTEHACLEYSWVPEGRRHLIQLMPGQKSGSSMDTIPDDLNPSHVQVYMLNNNDHVSTVMWQFPPGPPHTTPIVDAIVEVHEAQLLAVGTVRYVDGSTASDTRQLDPYRRPCPQV